MSVKNMLPIIGVGSAAALLGLVASRRSASPGAAKTAPRHRPSGISLRGSDAHPASDAPDELPAAPHGLPHGFWDATPESTSYPEYPDESASTRFVRERDDSSDRDDLSADWLTRATQAPMQRDATDDDYDDPAEIPADSLSMISDASRHAAARAVDDDTDDDDDADGVSER